MPSVRIRCSGCDFESTNSNRPVLSFYRLDDGREIPGLHARGWCNDCNDVSVIELLSPDDSYESRWNFLKDAGHEDLITEENEVISYLAHRVSGSACFTCWSKNTVPLVVDRSEVKKLEEERRLMDSRWEVKLKEIQAVPAIEFATKRQKGYLQEIAGREDSEAERKFFIQAKVVPEKNNAIAFAKHEFFKAIDAEIEKARKQWRYSGFTHQCGGALLAHEDEPDSVRLQSEVYVLDLEGNLLGEG